MHLFVTTEATDVNIFKDLSGKFGYYVNASSAYSGHWVAENLPIYPASQWAWASQNGGEDGRHYVTVSLSLF